DSEQGQRIAWCADADRFGSDTAHAAAGHSHVGYCFSAPDRRITLPAAGTGDPNRAVEPSASGTRIIFIDHHRAASSKAGVRAKLGATRKRANDGAGSVGQGLRTDPDIPAALRPRKRYPPV